MPPQARLGDMANCAADPHGCPACPHPAIGPAICGSPNVLVNNMPAIRKDDPGVHAACCNGNTWAVAKGSATVFVNSIAAARQGDMTKHCGKSPGTIVQGSPNVMTGG